MWKLLYSSEILLSALLLSSKSKIPLKCLTSKWRKMIFPGFLKKKLCTHTKKSVCLRMILLQISKRPGPGAWSYNCDWLTDGQTNGHTFVNVELFLRLKTWLNNTSFVLSDIQDKDATGWGLLMIPLLLKFKSWLIGFIFSPKYNDFN